MKTFISKQMKSAYENHAEALRIARDSNTAHTFIGTTLMSVWDSNLGHYLPVEDRPNVRAA
jgi:hypothetical protein